jgi:hypothetical protein
MQGRFGILAYGSLITEPGLEIERLVISKVKALTPFKVEFKRSSSSRGGAPTLIPVSAGGSSVFGEVFILKENNPAIIKSILWRRELHSTDSKREYREISNPTINTVQILSLDNFQNLEKVFYTSINQNIDEPVTGKILKELAINSILSNAGERFLDGVRYLRDMIKMGVKTPLIEEYVFEILDYTKARNLDDAIIFLDHIRKQK